MFRYLTPSQICLLVLVELYTEEAVPNDAMLPVLSFITSNLMGPHTLLPARDAQGRWKPAERAMSMLQSVDNFEQLLSPYAAAVGFPGRRLWDIFLNKLWKLDSLYALHEFFDTRHNLVRKSKRELQRWAELGEQPRTEGVLLAKNSPFGAFVRKCQNEFLRLQFNDMAELWGAFVRYRQPTAAAWGRRNPRSGRFSFDSVLSTGEQDWGSNTMAVAAVTYGDMLGGPPDARVPVSTHSMESLLEYQIEQMQKYGCRVPPTLQAKFQELLDNSYLVPAMAHYLKFLEAWRSGDHSTSFDSLHRYFDYTMRNRDRLFYQYALMNLAVLQADFGCYQDALDAMLETVSTARENRDMSCLNFALNWLFHFGQAHPRLVSDLESSSLLGTNKETLAFLRVKAKETQMWPLWCSALLSEAKVALASGDSIATALQHMARSSHLVVERNMKNMMGAQMALGIAFWDRIGAVSLSETACEVFLRCHARNCVFDDELKVTCRLAGLLAGRGRYDEAMRTLEAVDASALRAWKQNQYWLKYRGLVKLRRDLHRGDLDGADHLLSQLLQAKPDDLEPDLDFVVDAFHIEAMTRRGDLEAAFAKVERMIARSQDRSGDVATRIRLLLTKAHLFDRAGRPQRGFTIAMRAASLAWRARLLPLLWQAIGAVARILVALGEFEAARQLLVATLPRCLECDLAYAAGQLYATLADAHMGLAGRMPAGSHKRELCMAQASETAKLAFDHFSSVEDLEKQCEMTAKQATIMKVMGDLKLADDLAAKYLELRRASVRSA